MVIVVWLLALFPFPAEVKVEELIEVKVLFVISTVGSVVVAVANAPTLGKSFMFIKSSYKLCEKVSVPMSKKVVVLSGTLGTDAANWNRFSAPESRVMELMSGGLSTSVVPAL